jgi:peptidoglycan/LPS O-acetylase OafA/YrhL
LYLLGFLHGTFSEILSIYYHRGAIELSPAQFWMTLPFAAVMLPAPGSDLFPFDIPMWSVFFELLINLVWAILWKPLRSNRTLIAIILLSGLGLLVSVVSAQKLTTLGATWPTFAGGFFRVSYSFFVGVLLYRVRNARVIPQMPSMFFLAALPAFLFLPLGTSVQLIAVLFILPWFVLLGCRAQSRGWTRVISHQLGAASYGVYTLHYPAYLLSYAAALEILGVDLGRFDPWIGIAFIFVVITACLILNLYYERPARQWLARRFDATIVPEQVTQAP